MANTAGKPAESLGGAPGGSTTSNGQVGGAGGAGAGVIYLIVGKTLSIQSTGKITAVGQNGFSGNSSTGGGGGGGSINLFYGINFVNSGSLSVAGGTGGNTGGLGSLTITKILTN
jgi:hypothetical protein